MTAQYETASSVTGGIPLLRTKLNVPRAGGQLVARARLTERLSRGVEGRLTVVSAPAGFGKTTLLAEWLASTDAGGRSVAWVSLDASENDPVLFWSYVMQALASVHPSIGRESGAMLRSTGGASMDAVLTVLLNEVADANLQLVLVLDDYHVIDAPAIHAALAFVIEHQPTCMNVVLGTRSDPPLPLARLRARGELTELTASELRFQVDEASTLLNDVLSLSLSPAEVAELEQRTEGWVTAIKLAASTSARTAAQGARAFQGGSGYIADYVIDEVLRAEPEDVRDFLLDTSVLERLSAPLCDEVTQRRDSRRVLHDLASRNFFVVALDDAAEWYRYHHLFADVLQAHARRHDAERVRVAHQRASVWYESSGLRIEATAHALAAGDHARAADLLEAEWPERNRSHQSSRWLRQARTLPQSLLAARPSLAMGYAWALLNGGEADAAQGPLRQVEQWLAEPDGAVDIERHRALTAEAAAARAYLSQMSGDADSTIEHARRSLEHTPADDHAGRITGTALIALAQWGSGRLEEAHATFSAALRHMRLAGKQHDALRGIFVLGDLRVDQGRLRDAAQTYAAGLREAASYDAAVPPEVDELYIGLAEVHCERDELDEAERLLEQVRVSWLRAQHRADRERWSKARARVRLARGDLDGALALLDEAQAHAVPGPLPRTRPIPALRARVNLSAGRLIEASAWVESSGVTSEDEVAYTREFELLTLARVLVARSRAGEGAAPLEEAIGLSARVADVTQRAARKGSLLDALAVQSLALAAAGRQRPALDALARALELAEPEGHLRVFADEGAPMRDLLRHALARGVAPEASQRVLAAFDPPATGAAALAPEGGSEQLTSREVVILRLLATGLRNQEIAEHLFISPATVKRHIANIYLKLQVGHRTAALARAAELKLI